MTQPLAIQVNNLSQRVSAGKEQLTILDQIQLQVKSGESPLLLVPPVRVNRRYWVCWRV